MDERFSSSGEEMRNDSTSQKVQKRKKCGRDARVGNIGFNAAREAKQKKGRSAMDQG